MNNGEGSLTFIRKKCVSAWGVPVDIYIDGLFYGGVRNNSTKQIFVGYGTHTLIAKADHGENSFQFTISENQKNLVYEIKVKVGFYYPLVELNLIQSYN